MVDQLLKDQILLMFRARDFEGMWFIIKNQYDELGFTDPMTDQQKIDEYKWIVQQLRKFMFTKQDDVLSCDSLESMVACVEKMIGNAEEYGDERKKVVYNFMRDHWLYELKDHLTMLLYELQEEVEEDE